MQQMNNGTAGYVPAVVGISPHMAQAITEHYSAWANFQIAVGEEVSGRAEDAESDAMFRLLATPAADLADVRALMQHLDWYSREERFRRFSGTRDLGDMPFVMFDQLRLAVALGVTATVDLVEVRA